MQDCEIIKFNINGWVYSIKAEKKFAHYLKDEIDKDFSTVSADGRKTILFAYMKAKYQLFKQDKMIEKMIKEIP
jgi:hypothetical protein